MTQVFRNGREHVHAGGVAPTPLDAPPALRLLFIDGLRGLGLFSYSVYLIHLPLVMVLGEFAMHHLSNTQNVLFQLFLVVPLMLGLGYLFHLLFERPFMNAPRDGTPSPRAAGFRFRWLSPGKDPVGPTPLVVSTVSEEAVSPTGLVFEPVSPIM